MRRIQAWKSEKKARWGASKLGNLGRSLDEADASLEVPKSGNSAIVSAKL